MTDAHVTTDHVASHTPGPWSVEDPIGGELSIVEVNKPTHEWKFIATVYLREGNDPDEFPHLVSEANARLIAAAPDLLAIAKQCASECAGCSGAGTWARVTNVAGPAIREPCEDCADIRKVIDKAEGRS